MAKSRLAVLVLSGSIWASPGLALPADAPSLSAEGAIENQRRELVSAARIGCRRIDESEILVCGRQGADPNRITVEAVAGDRANLMPGELPNGVEASHLGSERCSTVGPNQRCGGGLDAFLVAGVLYKIGKHLLDPDE